MLAHVVDITILKTRPTNHKRLDQNLRNKKIKNKLCHMHKSKINLQSALNKSEAGKTSPDQIKLDQHCRHTAIVIVSAMKLIREQKRKRKLFIKVRKKKQNFLHKKS